MVDENNGLGEQDVFELTADQVAYAGEAARRSAFGGKPEVVPPKAHAGKDLLRDAFAGLGGASQIHSGAMDIRALREGQAVQVWSESGKRWEPARVVQKTRRDPDGLLIRVEYGAPPREKWLDAALTSRVVRRPRAVQVWSESGQRWERGEVVQKVERDELDGPVIQVRYGDPPREKWLDAALTARHVKFVQ